MRAGQFGLLQIGAAKIYGRQFLQGRIGPGPAGMVGQLTFMPCQD